MLKCSDIAVIGRPSAGKSTLINTICEMKVSITSSIPQTTRNNIRGIYTDSRGQLIFTDTPGYHLSDKKLNRMLQQSATDPLKEADTVLYIIDPTRKSGEEEKTIAKMIADIRTPVIAVINKQDIATEEQIAKSTEFLSTMLPDSKILTASAMNDEGVDEILIELFRLAPEGEIHYPEDMRTDQSLTFRLAEIIREKAIATVRDELPHCIFVEIADLEDHDNTIWLRAFINVETESQRGILVGKKGKNIRKIRVESFKEITRIFPGRKLQLDLRVKTSSGWRKNDFLLQRVLDSDNQ